MSNPWKSYGRNPYAGRYRVEEDKFAKVPCNTTRISSSASGNCLQGYRLMPGLAIVSNRTDSVCDMALDVVMYNIGTLSIEASTLIVDPYKVTAIGSSARFCYVNAYPDYNQEDFQDTNQVTRRGVNWRAWLTVMRKTNRLNSPMELTMHRHSQARPALARRVHVYCECQRLSG